MSMRTLSAGVVALIVVAGLVFLWSSRVLIYRHYTQGTPNQVNGYTWYAPTESITGNHDGFFEVAPADQRTISADAIAAASAYAQSKRSESLLIWHRGALQHAEYWLGLGPEDVVNSRSMHKMVGGLLIARAIADGFINSIDDSVADYIPAWRGTDKAAITIRNVLHMSSGLRWFSIRDRPPFGLSSRRYLDPKWDRVLLEDIPMSFTPGTEYDYSDTTADVMPHIIQGATGKRYAEYFSDALIKPLAAKGGFLWINREGGMPHGGCCLMLPPETWLRFGLLLLNGGAWNGQQLLPGTWRAEMVQPSENKDQFGLMIWLGKPYLERRLYHRPESPINQVPKPGVYNSEPFLADDLFMFDGAEGRMVYIIPSEDLVIVRTGFRPAPGEPEWDNTFLPNTIMRGTVGTEGGQL
ncbi:MAG: serine hydrolase [Rhodospirillaceae bacterium]|jgi:CubicO group peptidase (beta-lactamase class C family)|nr:serine hydrolase [Rhodospirillaceae bacterium]